MLRLESRTVGSWLEPIQLAVNYGFRGRDLTEIERLIQSHQAELLGAWNDYFA